MFTWQKEQKTATTGRLKCPACVNEMHIFRWRGVEVDICGACKGIWFDFGEMKAIEIAGDLPEIDAAFEGEFTERPVEEAKEDPDRHCPLDGSKLDRYNWFFDTGIMMDGCKECQGVFLDAGELEGYIAYLEQNQAEPIRMSDQQKAEIERLQQETEDDINKFVSDVHWDFLETFMTKFENAHRALKGKPDSPVDGK